jgi:hypothetical protein
MDNLDILEENCYLWIASTISTFDLKHSYELCTCLFSSAVLAGPLITVPDEEKREP